MAIYSTLPSLFHKEAREIEADRMKEALEQFTNEMSQLLCQDLSAQEAPRLRLR